MILLNWPVVPWPPECIYYMVALYSAGGSQFSYYIICFLLESMWLASR